MLTLNEHEISALVRSPDALQVLLDYHDRNITEYEAMDYSCTWQHQRVAEIQAEKAVLEAKQKEWDE